MKTSRDKTPIHVHLYAKHYAELHDVNHRDGDPPHPFRNGYHDALNPRHQTRDQRSLESAFLRQFIRRLPRG